MHDQRPAVDVGQLRPDVVVREALPDRLLDSSHDSKWCQIVGPRPICEIPGYAQFERPLAVRIGVACRESRLLQRGALTRHRLLPRRHVGLELRTILSRDGRRVNQDETPRPNRARSRRQERQQRAPRESDDGRRLQLEFGDNSRQILDLGTPGDRAWRRRSASATLVVERRFTALGQVQQLGL